MSPTGASGSAGLDPRQREAVEAPLGPLLILAGAGSGKTRVLTERAAALAAGPLDPGAVLVITFTNRAADELRVRLGALLGETSAGRMTVGTFHAICHRMLRNHARRAGRSPSFSVYDGHASLRLIAQTLAEEAAQLSPRVVALQMGQARARLLGPDDYRALAQGSRALAVARAWERYNRALERSDALDFDELLVRGVRLLEEPDLLDACRRRWQAILVDEYQDTNRAQDEWVRRVTGTRRALTVVADDDQAIYGWRGGDIAGILDFERNHLEARQVTLERNYRSSGAIVAAAARLIGHNQRRRRKTMWTEAQPGLPVVAVRFRDELEEAREAAIWCSDLIERATAPGEIAVLFRTRVQARPMEDALLAAGIPCRVVGSQGLWESASVRDLVAHLTLLVNPRDELALARALKSQPGAGAAAVARVLVAAHSHEGDLIDACVAAPELPGLRGRQALAVETFGRILGELRRGLPAHGVAATCSDAVVATGLAERLRRVGDERSNDQIERLRRFCLAARRYERDGGRASLQDFLAQAALSADEDARTDPGLVTLSTLHAAKGAEWDHVRITGLCEGLLPHERALHCGEVEEERRLAYVGMTRARLELTLSWPQRRHGRIAQPSRFLSEAGLALPAAPPRRTHTGGRKAA